MKKIIFTAYSLNVGGIEKALINLLKKLDYNKYEVTLLIQKKQGELLNDLPKEVKVIEYKISDNRIVILRKIYNRLKLIFNVIKNYHKYDFACCYAPYSVPGAILARNYSKNNLYWVHSDYYNLYQQDVNKMKHFFDGRKISKFNHIVFVAKEAMDNFKLAYKNLDNKLLTCNNLIDIMDIDIKKDEKISLKKPNKPLFINVSRHDEHSKKLTRLIEAAKILKDKKIDFEMWFIGDGPDTKMYESLIDKYSLRTNIKMLGLKVNPYPYYKLADASILTSDYEGFPVVYLEAAYFKLPIITTIDLSIDNVLMSNGYAVIVNKDEISIANAIEDFIKNKSEFKSIDLEKYNEDITNKINNMIENNW